MYYNFVLCLSTPPNNNNSHNNIFLSQNSHFITAIMPLLTVEQKKSIHCCFFVSWFARFLSLSYFFCSRLSRASGTKMNNNRKARKTKVDNRKKVPFVLFINLMNLLTFYHCRFFFAGFPKFINSSEKTYDVILFLLLLYHIIIVVGSSMILLFDFCV